MNIKESLKKISMGNSLDEMESYGCFSALFDGKIQDSQAGAFLFGLKVKGESVSELAGAVKAAINRAKLVDVKKDKIIDTCGTGGDGKSSFNCSTAVAFFLADMGFKVVKHGNRAVSSSCGSADILEKLRIPFPKSESEVNDMLDKFNFGFLYAPYFHPSFKNVAELRRGLGVPTIFNLMGPLLNPARPKYQLLGVADPKVMAMVAYVLKNMGIKRAAVVHGAGGFDELSPCGVSEVILIDNGRSRHIFIDPREFGIGLSKIEDIICDSKEESEKMMITLLEGIAPSPVKDMVALNLGLSIHLLDEEMSLRDCIMVARKKVDMGITKIKEFVLC